MTRIRIFALAAVLAVAATACSSSKDSTDTATQNTTATTVAVNSTAATVTTVAAATTTTLVPNAVGMKSFAFVGIDNTKAGATWVIKNEDSAPHTISADDGSFVWRVEANSTGTFAKTLAAGSYKIHCDVHPDLMKGTLVVK